MCDAMYIKKTKPLASGVVFPGGVGGNSEALA